jgi:hypothetical protein
MASAPKPQPADPPDRTVEPDIEPPAPPRIDPEESRDAPVKESGQPKAKRASRR